MVDKKATSHCFIAFLTSGIDISLAVVHLLHTCQWSLLVSSLL